MILRLKFATSLQKREKRRHPRAPRVAEVGLGHRRQVRQRRPLRVRLRHVAETYAQGSPLSHLAPVPEPNLGDARRSWMSPLFTFL